MTSEEREAFKHELFEVAANALRRARESRARFGGGDYYSSPEQDRVDRARDEAVDDALREAQEAFEAAAEPKTAPDSEGCPHHPVPGRPCRPVVCDRAGQDGKTRCCFCSKEGEERR